ncbi:putative ribonuclease H-like domain-containing protein [Tanacetum coccineum]
MIKYSFGQNEEHIAVKEDEYEDLTSTSEDACRAYKEIFRKMDEGWMLLMAGSEDDIPPPPPLPSQTPTQQTPHTVSTIKLPILKKEEYDIWDMKMEHYLAHIDYPIWEVIQRVNGPAFSTEMLIRNSLGPLPSAWSSSFLNHEDQARPTASFSSQPLVTLDGEGVDWTSHSEDEQENYAFMACNSSSSDTERKQLGDASIEIQAYTQALKKVEAQLAAHQQSQLCQMSARDKAGLGYGDQLNKGVLSYENEVFQSVFVSRTSETENSPVNDRYAEGMHVVPPPMTGIYIPSGPDKEIDDSQFTYGPKQSKPSESDARSSDFNSCESNCSEETHESMPELVVNEPRVVCEPKVWSDAPIIEEYESDSEDEHVELNKQKGKGNVQRENKLVWNNVHRVNHKNQFVPRVVLTRTGKIPVNTARHNFNSKAVLTNAARKISTLKPFVNNARPKTGNSEIENESAQDYFILPIWSSYTSTFKSSKANNAGEEPNKNPDLKTNEKPIDKEDQVFLDELERLKRQEQDANNAAEALRKEFAKDTKDLLLQAGAAKASSTNTVNTASTPVSTASTYSGLSFTDMDQDDSKSPALEDMYDHPTDGIFTNASYDDEDPNSAVQTRSKVTKSSEAYAFKAIGTKWVYRNKKDKIGVVVRNKARLVAQGHRQEEGIYYDEVFAPVAEIEAIRIFLAFASYMGFICYQMDVKSAFLYGKIDEVVYVSQTSQRLQFLGKRLISKALKKQTIVATSTTEAEYVAAANCCGQVLWIQNQMLDYGFNFMNTKIYIDNESTICIVKNLVFHSKTKHIAIRHHFIRDAYEKKLIQVLKIHTDDNVADLLTKAFDVNSFLTKLQSQSSYCNVSVTLLHMLNSFGKPICYDDDEDDTIAITPVLPIKEPDNSLSMGDEHLDTVPATESDEVIKSSVEDLVPIPSESEGIPDKMCDVPLCENTTPLNALNEHYEIVVNSDDDNSSSDDDSSYGENIDYVDASPPDVEIVSLEVVEIIVPEVGRIDDDILLTIKDDTLREKLLNVNLLIAKIDALRDNPTPSSDVVTKSTSTFSNLFLEETNTFDNSIPESETFRFNLEEISSGSSTTHSELSLPDYKAFYIDNDRFKEKSSGSTTTHVDFSQYDSFIFDLSNDHFPPADRSDLYHEEFANELTHIMSLSNLECFKFKIEPDPGDLTSINPVIHKNVSTTNVNVPLEDDQYSLFAASQVVPKVDDVSLVDGVFDGAFGGNREEDFVTGEGVVVSSSSLDRSTRSCFGGIMVSLIFLEGLEEEACVDAMEVEEK